MPQPKSLSLLEAVNIGDKILFDSDADDVGQVVEASEQVERLARKEQL